jgi:biopolymer transport protein ExbB/TolQ
LSLVNGLQQLIYDVARILLWPVLIAAILCLIWVFIELGFFLYELWLRFRYRDLEALEACALRARKAFADGKPRTAYRYLQENRYSIIVARFLFELIRNYQTERLEAKPLKLLQEYEFYTLKRLERTRILVRVGPTLGLMGTLIPLSPALVGLAKGNTTQLADNLVTAFSVTVLGLLIGGIAFAISIVRDRLYSQDISDMEYMLELLEGRAGRLKSGRRLSKRGVWEGEPAVEYDEVPEEPTAAAPEGSPAAPADGVPEASTTAALPIVPAAMEEPAAPATPTSAPAGAARLGFDDPEMNWQKDEDPFADLGPVDTEPPAWDAAAPGSDRPA